MKKILFGMNNTGFGEIGSVFRNSKFDVVESPISFVNMLNDGIERFEPDVVLISMIRIGFDSQEKNEQEKELIDFIYSVRKSDNSNLRIGIITQYDNPKNSLFLNAITQLGVWDIYNIPDNNGTLNLQGISRGLSMVMNPDTFIELIGERDSSANLKSLFEDTNELESKDRKIAQLESKNELLDNQNTELLEEISALKNRIAESNKNVSKKKSKNSSIVVNKQKRIPSTKQIQKPKHVEKSKVPKNLKKNSSKSRFFLIGILITALICAGCIYWLQFSAKANSKPSLSSYLNKKEYVNAVSTYPKEVKKIENDLLDDESIDITEKKIDIKRIESINNDPTVKFDNAFFEKNYKKALNIYQNNTDEFGSLSDVRRKELGLCYSQVNEYSLALDVTDKLDDDELKNYIRNRQIAYQNIQEEQSALNHEGLNDLDKMKLNQMIKKNKKTLEN
ncbi:hypothetical protein [Latilactobacillus sakei]|uniref:hypothetical protein n=1 Tax=Latilactobacillus sakei TaxID=1599 RepID=UPI00202E452B|nr:hypothetical protein [Latilactobacillus sakei]MCM1636273.1 hypothetical protein [Latilactobacillus sakei]